MMINVFGIFVVLATFIQNIQSQESVPSGLIPTLLQLNTGWSELHFNLTESDWIPNLYKVFSPVPFSVYYSDAFCPGKMVSIYVNGTFMMNSTSVPEQVGTCDPRIDQAFGTYALPTIFSHAKLDLPGGNHEISIKLIQSDPSYPTGTMFLRGAIMPHFTCNPSKN